MMHQQYVQCFPPLCLRNTAGTSPHLVFSDYFNIFKTNNVTQSPYMLRMLLLTGVLLSACLLSPAQTPTDRSPGDLLLLLKNSRPDTTRAKWLLQLADFYLNKPDEHKNDLDSAMLLARNGERLSDSLHYTPGKYFGLGIQARVHFERGDVPQGKALFKKVIEFYRQSGNTQEMLHWMQYFAMFLPELEGNYAEKVHIFNQMLQIARQLRDQEKEFSTLRDIADVYLRWGKLDTAEYKLRELLRLQQSRGIRQLHYTYDLLTAVSTFQGNFNKALLYSIETIRYMQATGDSTSASIFFNRMGTIYRELGQHEKSTPWYRKAFETMQQNKHSSRFVVCGHLVRSLIKQGKQQEALSFLRNTIKNDPPSTITDREEVARSMGDCFSALQRYDLAERYYQEMMVHEGRHIAGNNYYSLEAYYVIGKFYADRQQYNKAAYYLQQALALSPAKKNFASRIKDIHLALFKVDSATGNYLSAIQHLGLHNRLNDSIFNETSSKQIAELQVQYETAKKEQDIKLLHKERQLERNKLQQARLGRNVTLGGIVLLLAIVGLLYSRYRMKQRSNRQLEAQQQEIHLKNHSLQELLLEKDRLLEEKEWLLKEIHHRVKNNLQIVMSLLNTQSAYIENDAALVVIRENQHRVYAMSLIHQKLYQSENMALIDIPVYISELVDYLRNSFDTRHIRFELDIASIKLDVAQTVPMGLILNEAVTNAIKYGFPGNRTGVITVALRRESDHRLWLTITDNGIGLPADVHTAGAGSLGMSLMEGLSRQLEGSFHIESNNGVIITVTFIDDRTAALAPAAPDLLTEIVPYE